METISNINYYLITVYTVFAVFVILSTAINGIDTDPAGKGIVFGHMLMVGILFVVAILLNQFPHAPTKIFSFIILLYLLFTILQQFLPSSKTLSIINWVILGIYWLIAFFILGDVFLKGLNSDPAGNAMTEGFITIGILVLIIVTFISFLPFRLTKVITLVLLLLPILNYGYNWSNQRIHNIKNATGANYFKDKQLKRLAANITQGNLKDFLGDIDSDWFNADINHIGIGDMTLLQIAVLTNTYKTHWVESAQQYMEEPDNSVSFHIVDKLLSKGAKPNLHHPAKDPPIIHAAEHGSTVMVKLLLEHGANPNTRFVYDSIPILCRLIGRGGKRANSKIKLLLAHDADVNIEFSDFGWGGNLNLLLIAVSEKRWEVCQWLLERGANPNFQSSNEYMRTFDGWLEYFKEEYAQKGEQPEDFKNLLKYIEEGLAAGD